LKTFKEGDIVFVIDNRKLYDKNILPNKLVSYLFYYYHTHKRLSIKTINGDSYTIYSETFEDGNWEGPLIRKATEQEEFLFHIMGKPFVIED